MGKLIGALLVMVFLFWATFKIGTGLGYWWPFIAICFGTLVAILYAVTEKLRKK